MSKDPLTRIEHICKLYHATGSGCHDRLPHTLPYQPCCRDCVNEACKRRCLNTPEKCGQAYTWRHTKYQPFMYIEEVF